MRLLRILTLLPLLLLMRFLAAGELLPEGRVRCRAYTEEMGLRSQNVQALALDSEGILHVGTASGLYRFGGSKFSLIPLRKDLEAPTVLSLLPHPKGGVWVGTINGLAWVRGGDVRWATMEGTQHNLSIYTMALDQGGLLWFADRRGLFRQTGETHFQVDPRTATWVKESLWMASAPLGGGVVALEAGKVLHRLKSDGSWQNFPVNVPIPHQFILDARGTTWHIHRREVRRLAAGATTFLQEPHPLPVDPADNYQAFPDSAGGLWIPTVEGLLRRSEGVDHRIRNTRGLPEEGVFLVYPDPQGNLWFGGVGLYRLLGGGWFQAFDTKDGLPGSVVWSVARARHDGRLLVGTQTGLAELVQGRFQPVPGTQGQNIAQIVEDAEGTVWLTSKGSGLLRWRPGTPRPVRVGAFKGDYPGRMLLSPDGSLYINGSTLGLLRLWPQGAQEPRVEVVDVPTSPTGTKGVTRVALDGSGRLWASAWYGLLVREGGAWKTFTTRDGLLHDGTQDVTVTSDGDLWVRYEEPVGVSRFHYAEGRLQLREHLREREGLTTNLVYSVFPESGGNLWLLTDRGVIRRRGGVFTTLTRLDGLPTNDCDEDAFWKDADGAVWVGQSNGLVRFDPVGLPDPVPPPEARLVGMADARREWRFPGQSNPASFPIQEASLTFRFAPKGFQHEGAVRFQVRLEGLEEDWRGVDGSFVQYPKLREGTYVFRVRCARMGEPWGVPAKLAFRVLPPWYRTWWAYAAGGLFLAVLGGGIVRLRLRSLTHQRDHLEAQVALRTREIQQAQAALEVANESLRAQSLTDPLTGLRNRRYLQEALPQDVCKVLHLHRFSGRNGRRGDLSNPDLVFLLVDLDHFKHINDVHGHHVGDMVLQGMGQLLQQAMRDTDAIVRWGGEEFLVVARETCRTEGPRLAERIRAHVAQHRFPTESGLELQVTCSVGFAPFPLDMNASTTSPWERAVDLADAGLYIAKRSGRNGWVGVTDVLFEAEGIWSLPRLQAEHEAGRVVMEASFQRLSFET